VLAPLLLLLFLLLLGLNDLGLVLTVVQLHFVLRGDFGRNGLLRLNGDEGDLGNSGL